MIPMSTMKSNDQLTRISRFLSLILRHDPGAAGITLDEHGWADVDELISKVSKTMPLDMETLEEIVRTDGKQRYSFNADKTLIRANQGHSIPVDLGKAQSPGIVRRESHFSDFFDGLAAAHTGRLFQFFWYG